jgi:hypothetical protein
LKNSKLSKAIKKDLSPLRKKLEHLLTLFTRIIREKSPINPSGVEANTVNDQFDATHQLGRNLQGESTSAGGVYTKALRLEFPTFNGDDPDSWYYRVEQFFDFYDIHKERKFKIIAFYMESKALSWFKAMRNTNSLSTWDEFVLVIKVRFGKGSYVDPMENLSKLKQTGLLEEYKTQFELLANRVLRWNDSHKLSMFSGGLRDDTRVPVRMFNPKTLNDAYALARMREECIMINTKYGKPV